MNSRLVKVLLLFLLITQQSIACNLSDLTLISVSGTGPYTIVIRLCVGQGITGVVRGADGATQSLGFNFMGPGITLVSYSPTSITGSFTGCTMTSFDLGPQGMPFNSDLTLFYLDPGYYGLPPCVTQPYACITTTALCGNVSQNCTDFTFVTNIMPTMIEAFGVEGGGNPVAGCWPDSDMRITNFTLAVEWNEINAKVVNKNNVLLNWSTFSEENSDYYVVERVSDFTEHHLDWVSVDTIEAKNSTQLTQYFYEDNQLNNGLYYYRIKAVEKSGDFSYSKYIIVNLSNESVLKIYPNPTHSILSIETNKHDRFELINSLGEPVIQSNLSTSSTNSFPVSHLPKGIYLACLSNLSNEKYIEKIIIE